MVLNGWVTKDIKKSTRSDLLRDELQFMFDGQPCSTVNRPKTFFGSPQFWPGMFPMFINTWKYSYFWAPESIEWKIYAAINRPQLRTTVLFNVPVSNLGKIMQNYRDKNEKTFMHIKNDKIILRKNSNQLKKSQKKTEQ